MSRSPSSKPIVILMVDDDHEDREFAREAFEESRLANDFRTVDDGVELLEYLRREGAYAKPGAAPRPGLILLDLQMPRLDGFQTLEQIRADPSLARIPVVVMTTSGADEDISRSYDAGANSYVRKPVTFDGLVDAVRAMGRYWLEIVELPRDARE
ncbi:MAG: response regulator [Gemmatimonadota bacterium]